jgi:hypothetical protein
MMLLIRKSKHGKSRLFLCMRPPKLRWTDT